MTAKPASLHRFNRRKRLLDLAVVALTAPVWAPLTAAVAAVVAARLGRPVLFRQPRAGLDEQTFDVLKFRSMTDATDATGALLPDAQRLTPTGRWLRRLSLDELPQLLNVVRGDMSIIGPRPLYPRYLPHYSTLERSRHTVRPGITGWAQVNGRNFSPWDQRLALDAQYVARHRLSDDARIVAKTISQVLRREGVSVVAGETGRPLDVERGRSVTLRALTLEDLPERVTWMGDARVRAHMQLPDHPELRSTVDWFHRRDAGPERHDFVAMDDAGRRVAMAGVKRDADDHAEFYVFVDPERAGQGLGVATTRAVLDWVDQNGTFRGCSLTVARSNERAVRMYRALGFAVTSHDEERWWMVRHG